VTTYPLSHLSDSTLEHGLDQFDDRERSSMAALLAHLAEFDERRRYVPAGFPSLFLYCVEHRRWCEQAALKRIRVARTARQYPAIFPAPADGRLHLSAVVLLTPYLTPENADELLKRATHQSKAAIAKLIAERFPQPDAPTLVQGGLSPNAATVPGDSGSPGFRKS